MTEHPHAAAPDEDPAEHIGEEIPDPWDDPAQTDWSDNRPDREVTVWQSS